MLAIPAALIGADSPKDNWVDRADVDKVTDRKDFYMYLIAEGQAFKIGNWINKSWPRLITGCRGGDSFFAVSLAAPAKADFLERVSVISRYGGFTPVTTYWAAISGGTSLQVTRNPIGAAATLTKTDKFFVRYTPKEGPEVTLEFSVYGAKDHLPKIARACGWDYGKALRELR
jgi:hypothetical protein